MRGIYNKEEVYVTSKITKIQSKIVLDTLPNIIRGLTDCDLEIRKIAYNNLLEYSKAIPGKLDDIEVIMKENPFGVYGEGQEIKIEEFTIRNMSNYPDGSKSIYIQIEGEEGGQFSTKSFRECVEAFFNRYF